MIKANLMVCMVRKNTKTTRATNTKITRAAFIGGQCIRMPQAVPGWMTRITKMLEVIVAAVFFPP